jgi:hypothetical protein
MIMISITFALVCCFTGLPAQVHAARMTGRAPRQAGRARRAGDARGGGGQDVEQPPRGKGKDIASGSAMLACSHSRIAHQPGGVRRPVNLALELETICVPVRGRLRPMLACPSARVREYSACSHAFRHLACATAIRQVARRRGGAADAHVFSPCACDCVAACERAGVVACAARDARDGSFTPRTPLASIAQGREHAPASAVQTSPPCLQRGRCL